MCVDMTTEKKTPDFYVSPANKTAYAVVRMAAESLHAPCGPVYLYGQAGVGKTRLLHIAADAAREKNADCRVCLLTADRFLGELAAALSRNKIHTFRDRFDALDLLLVDDIEALAGMDYAQNEMSKIIRHLCENETPVILTGDQPADQLQGMGQEFADLLENGVPVEIKPLDFPDQVDLLARMAEEAGMDVGGDPEIQDALLYIADTSGGDTGAMKNAFERVQMFAGLLDEAVTADFAKKVLNR